MADNRRIQVILEVDAATGSAAIRKFGDDTNQAMTHAGRSASSLSGIFTKMIGAFAAYKVVDQLRQIGREGEQLQRNMMRTEQIVRTTGAAAGFSAQQIHEQARSLALSTLQNTEGVMQAQQVLLTFRKVSGDTFTRATDLAADLATVTGGNLTSAMTQLGKALEDPVRGVSALRESGVSFTASQQSVIKSLVATNDLAAAQKIILDELARQYGGVAKAEAQGLAGAMDTLGQAIQEARINFFEAGGSGEAFSATINAISTAIFNMIESGDIAAWAKNMASATLTAGGVMAQAFYGLQMAVSALQAGIAKVIEGYAKVRLLAIEKDSSGAANWLLQAPGRLLRGMTGKGFGETGKDEARQQFEELAEASKLWAEGSAADIKAVETNWQALQDKLSEIASHVGTVRESAKTATPVMEDLGTAFKAVTQDEMDEWLHMAEAIDEATTAAEVYSRAQMDLQGRLAEIQETLNAEFDAEFSKVQSAWADTVSSMIMHADSFGDFFNSMVKSMQQDFAKNISKMVADYAAGTLKMNAQSSGALGGAAGAGVMMAGQYAQRQGGMVGGVASGAMAGASFGPVGAIVGGAIGGVAGMFGSSGPSSLELAMGKLRDEVARNTEAMKDRTVVDSALDQFEALKSAADKAWDTLENSIIGPTIIGWAKKSTGIDPEFMQSIEETAARTEEGAKILAAYEQAQENLNIKLAEISADLMEEVAKAGESEIDAALRGVRGKWEGALEVAIKLDEQLDGTNHQYAVMLTAFAESERVTQEFAASVQATESAAGIAAQRVRDLGQIIKTTFDQARQNIKNALSGITENIAISRSGMAPSQYYLSQIRAFQGAPSGLTADSLTAMSGVVAQWYSAAVSEAEQAAQSAAQPMAAAAESATTAAGASSSAAEIWKEVADRTRQLLERIDATMRGIRYSDLNVALPKEKFASASQDYGKLLSAARTGDEGAIQEYLGFANTYLQQAQGTHKSSAAYQDIYTQVMADMEGMKSRVQGQDYQQMLFREMQAAAAGTGATAGSTAATAGSTAAAAADLSAINAQFDQLASWLNTSLTDLENMAMTLNVNWQGLGGDSGKVIDLLSQAVDKYGWESDLVLNFVTSIADNFEGPLEERLRLLNFVGTSAGWESEAYLALLAKWGNDPQALVNAAIKDVNVDPIKILMSLDWGVSLDQFRTTMQAYLDYYRNTMQAYMDGGYGGATTAAATGAATTVAGSDAAWRELQSRISTRMTQLGVSWYASVTDLQALAAAQPSIMDTWLKDYGWKPYADGGIIDRPTRALMGENGPEAVIPLSGGRIPVQILGGGYSGLDYEKLAAAIEKLSTRPINVTVEVGGQVLDARIDSRSDDLRVKAERRRGGMTARNAIL